MTTKPAARDEREVVSTAPERIYLIIGEECPDSARFEDLTDVAWCEDKIDSNAIPYVKAALAESELAEVREQLAAAHDKIDKAWNRSTPVLDGFIPGALDAWKRPVKQNLPYDFSGNPGVNAMQYCNGWNDSGGYWKAHVNTVEAERDELRAELERVAKESRRILEILDHPTRSVTIFDADALRSALGSIDAARGVEG